MDPRNEWLWNARATHWVFKQIGDGSSWRDIAPCMDPHFDGAIPPDEAARQARVFKEAGINMVLTESLRRVMRFEAEGKTDRVISAIRMAADACHREGMKLIHHTTASFVGQNLAEIPEAQRDWLSIDATTGTYAFEPLWGGWYLWCLNHPEFRAEYFRLCRKIAAETGVDGFMVDEVYFRPGWHNCACPHCRAKYRTMTGHTLPDADAAFFWGNFDNPAWRDWMTFRCASVGDFYQDFQKAIREVHPHPVLMGCKSAETLEGAQHFGDSARERMRGVNTLFIELTGSATSLLYSWRYISANLMIYSGFSGYYGTPTFAILYHRAPERFLSWALRMAHGLRIKATASPLRLGEALSPDNHLLNYPEDLRAYSEWFAWEQWHAGALNGNAVPLANVGVLLSETSRDLLHHGIHMDYAREFMGWSERLTDAGLQYAFVLETEINQDRLRDFSLVILPNVICLAERACQVLLEYVNDGGGLVLTHRTGECNLDGSQRIGSQQLAHRLGVRRAAAEAVSVDFGTHGRGKWVYFAHRPGVAAYETINSIGSARKWDEAHAPSHSDKERRLQERLMLEAAEWALEEPLPLTVQPMPQGVLIKAFRKTETGEILVHLLNCRGENDVAFGETIPRDYDVAFPELEADLEICLRLSGAWKAEAFSPDWDGLRPLALRPADDGALALTFPRQALRRYTTVHIRQRNAIE